MTIGEAQKTGEQILRKAGIESKHIDTSLLLAKVTGKPRSWVFAHLDEKLSPSVAQDFLELINQRAQRVPLVHLTNTREFYGLDFYIDKNVLTPRMETEKMVEYAIAYAPRNSRLLDVGTGSGAIVTAIGKHRPDLELWATDVSERALDIAKRNLKAHQVSARLATSSLLEHVSGRFDTIAANLPYLRNDADLMPEVQKEPEVALFGGKDGLELYRQFFQQLPTYLSPDGFVFTECDPWQHDELIKIALRAGLAPIETKDYFILGFKKENPGG